MLPVYPSVLHPVEVVGASQPGGLAVLVDLHEQVTLMHVDGDQGLDLGTLEPVHLIQTHGGELFHDVFDVLLLPVEFSSAFLLGPFEAILHFVGPNHLDTEQRNLRGVLVDEILGLHGEAVLCAILAHLSY